MTNAIIKKRWPLAIVLIAGIVLGVFVAQAQVPPPYVYMIKHAPTSFTHGR